MLQRASIIARREWDLLQSRKRIAARPDRPLVARSAITLDHSGAEVWSHDPDLSIQGASMVKVITGWLALERLDPNHRVLIAAGDSPLPPTRTRPGDAADVETLVRLTLIASDGHAAGALARTVGEADLGFDHVRVASDSARRRFLELADQKVRAREWTGHTIADPVGADPANRYTTRQITNLFRQLGDASPRIHAIASKRSALVRIERRGKQIPVFVTNVYRPVTRALPELVAGKTGWQGGDGPAYFVWTWTHPDGRVFTSAIAESTRDDRPADARLVIDRSIEATS